MIKCEKCGAEYTTPQWPFCKGNPEDHGIPAGTKTAVFPFTVNHVDGKPMTIDSLQQLRKVEREYGVVFSAFSHGSSNNPDPVDDNLPKFRGNDEDVRRDHRDRYR